jgi:hypothetical protein
MLGPRALAPECILSGLPSGNPGRLLLCAWRGRPFPVDRDAGFERNNMRRKRASTGRVIKFHKVLLRASSTAQTLNISPPRLSWYLGDTVTTDMPSVRLTEHVRRRRQSESRSRRSSSAALAEATTWSQLHQAARSPKPQMFQQALWISGTDQEDEGPKKVDVLKCSMIGAGLERRSVP